MNPPYPPAALEALMADLESELVKRKESLQGDAPTRIRQAVWAFANDLPDHRRPGVAFVGVRDDGTPTGLEITDELLLQLADIKTDGNIVPPLTLSVDKRTLSGKAVAVVTVQPSDSPPVRFRGQTWIRTGPRRGIASVQDERILNEKRRHRDPHFDAQPVSSARLDPLDLRRFNEEGMPAAFDRTILAGNDRSSEERLRHQDDRLGRRSHATVTGLLVLGTRPQDFLPGAYVQFLRIAGTEWGDPVEDETRCDGPIVDLLERLDDKLAAHNRMAVDFTSAPVETRRSTYPLPALQQLVRNAVMHRTYEGTTARSACTGSTNRIEIASRGEPYGTVSRETFGQTGMVDYRNPNLSEAMRVLGLVQRFGFGIPTARRELKANGQPEPAFHFRSNWVQCTVRARA